MLLRFSNEQRAAEWHGERGRLVQDGRYAKEAAMLSKAPRGCPGCPCGVRGSQEVDKLLHNYGKSPFLMGKSTISMVIFNSYVKLPEGIRGYIIVTVVTIWYDIGMIIQYIYIYLYV